MINVKLVSFKCMGIMLANLCHPYILSTTVLSDTSIPQAIWLKDRASQWWEKIVNESFTADDWLFNFCMLWSTFLCLCNELRSAIQKTTTDMRPAISVERRVVMTLVYVNSDNWTIGHLLGVLTVLERDSIILQGLVDHTGCFTDLNVGWPGRVHDSRVFNNSDFFTKGECGSLFPQQTILMGGVRVPIVIFGDGVYPLRPWLKKPYIDTGSLSTPTKDSTIVKQELW